MQKLNKIHKLTELQGLIRANKVNHDETLNSGQLVTAVAVFFLCYYLTVLL